MNNFYVGVVENRHDPMALGRCQVRIVGLHTHDKTLLPTEDLPWAMPVVPITSAAMNGIGHSPNGPVEGTTVVIMYADKWQQRPIMMGAVGGDSGEPLSIADIDVDQRNQPVNPRDIELQVNPTTGTSITLPSTEGLEPDMVIQGEGIPSGTLITAIQGNTVQVSREVNIREPNIVTFDNAPTNLSQTRRALGSHAIGDGQEYSRQEQRRDRYEQGGLNGEVVPEVPENGDINDQIPTAPPPGSTNNRAAAAAGINALLAAADKVGLTTKEQKCALLGICGGESKWEPIQEAYNYSLGRIGEVFRFASAADCETYSRAPNKGISRRDFFSWCYGPTQRGANFLGNRTDEEGGMYYGRGFIQLTGRDNYRQFERLLKDVGIDAPIVDNPDLLITDINISAAVAAMYIKHRTSSSVAPTDHPGYFYAAKRAVGNNPPGIAETKQRYYEYFYGAAALGDVEKMVGQPRQQVIDEPYTGRPSVSQRTTQTGASTIGFRDPNNKYPLNDYRSEVSTNRLARGEQNTVYIAKEAARDTDVPLPLGGGTWNQPFVSYSPKYPYNHVRETESGHVEEWDDTPGFERISRYHRKGTYTDIDPVGNQINRIVGDNYIITENNGYVHISGSCNITVDGDTNIFARANANVEVAADANIQVGNNVNMGVTNDVNWVVGGNMTLKVDKDLTIESNNLTQQTRLATNFRTTSLTQEVLADSNIKVAGNSYTEITGDSHLLSEAGIYVESKATLDMLSNSAMNINSLSTMDILSSGVMNVDYSSGHFGEGAASAMTADPNQVKVSRPSQGEFSTFRDDLEAGEPIDEDQNDKIWGTDEVDESGNRIYNFIPLTAPSLELPVNAKKDQLLPEPNEVEATHETPEEYNTPAGRLRSFRHRDAFTGANPNPVVEETVAAPRAQVTGQIVDCEVIYGQERFNNDFRMSENFNLGMCADGGMGARHILQDQPVAGRTYTKQEIVCNLSQILKNCIEPLISQQILPGGAAGLNTSWKINSGYRMQSRNPNRQSRSQHCRGQAFDLGIIASGTEKYEKTHEIVQQIAAAVPYDQLILEYRYPSSCWIHISFKTDGNRGQAFTMVNDSTYSQGFTLITNIPSP